MTELIYIPLHIIFIILTNYFPKYFALNILKLKTTLLSRLTIGISLNLLIFIIISFFNVNTLEIIKFYLILVFLINLFFFIKENLIFDDGFLNLILIFTITLAVSVWLANNFQLGWDPHHIWFPKALNFFYDQNISNLIDVNRPEYPYLGSLVWAIYYKFSLVQYEYFGRIFYIYFYILSIFSVSEILNQKNIFKVFAALLIISLSFKFKLFNGYQEILVFSVFTIISKYFYLMTQDDKKDFNFYIILILIFSLIWLKNEAIFFSFAFIVSFIFYKKFKSIVKIKLILLFIFFIFLRLIVFNYYDLEQALQPDNYNDLNLFNENFLNFSRIFLIFKFFVFGILDNMMLLLSIIIIGASIVFNNKNHPIFYSYLIFLISSLLIIFFAYMFSSMPLEWHLKVSINRLLTEITGYFAIIILVFVNQNLKRI